MTNKWNKQPFFLSIAIFFFTAFVLTMVQLKVDNPMLLAERFFPGAGWVEIFLISLYGAVVGFHMHDPKKSATWRKYTWLVFSIFFFSQLILGIFIDSTFLMTGKLHIPVPAIILAGPVYRFETSFMTILFLSTIVLSGPAWCSHLCYFGAWDNFAAKGNPSRKPIKNRNAIKASGILLVIIITLTLRMLKVSALTATLFGVGFGIVGIAVMLFFSRKKGKMIHCVTYCPIGTIVNYLKYINPFRMRINATTCTQCMACIPSCKYDALNSTDIKNGKPGSTCTFCGDCLAACHTHSIEYHFLGMKPKTARNFYLFITISLHAIFMALARL